MTEGPSTADTPAAADAGGPVRQASPRARGDSATHASRPRSPGRGSGRTKDAARPRRRAGTEAEPAAARQRDAREIVARQRAALQSDSVEILLKQKGALEAELAKLRRWRSSVGASFKLAWSQEREAHQRDVDRLTRAQVAADSRASDLERALEGERAAREKAGASARAEAERLRAECAAARGKLEAARRDADEAVDALRAQLARARAEKGALCDEFVRKLEGLGAHGGVVEASGFCVRMSVGAEGGACAGAHPAGGTPGAPSTPGAAGPAATPGSCELLRSVQSVEGYGGL